jgi:ribosomal protein S10
MTFVTRLRFQSGDREALDETVDELTELLRRKGAECKGPHTHPSERVRVPLYETLGPGAELDDWSYEVYLRELEIHGNDQVAREIGHRDFHDAVHVEIEVDQKKPLGQGRGN